METLRRECVVHCHRVWAIFLPILAGAEQKIWDFSDSFSNPKGEEKPRITRFTKILKNKAQANKPVREEVLLMQEQRDRETMELRAAIRVEGQKIIGFTSIQSTQGKKGILSRVEIKANGDELFSTTNQDPKWTIESRKKGGKYIRTIEVNGKKKTVPFSDEDKKYHQGKILQLRQLMSQVIDIINSQGLYDCLSSGVLDVSQQDAPTTHSATRESIARAQNHFQGRLKFSCV